MSGTLTPVGARTSVYTTTVMENDHDGSARTHLETSGVVSHDGS